MAIQDIRRSEPLPSVRLNDPVTLEIYNSYMELSSQTNDIHNRIQQFGAAIGNGLTTISVVMAHPTFTTNYCVAVELSFDNGGWWITNKTKFGFDLNWVTASVGDQTARFIVVE